MHDRAVPAGNAAECAFKQDRFWAFTVRAMHQGNPLSDAELIKLAKNASVPDIDAFKQCVESMQYEDVVNSDQQQGQTKGVSATPTFFINGEKVEGAQPFSRFQTVIENQLSTE
jgi:protein-disulfide isomerase